MLMLFLCQFVFFPTKDCKEFHYFLLISWRVHVHPLHPLATPMYADDAKIMNCVSDEFDQTRLQSDLDTLTKWSREWQLTFNVNKCKVMHLLIRFLV